MGIVGRHEWYVDGIRPLCVPVEEVGTQHFVVPIFLDANASGTLFERRCPIGKAISGISGRAGSRIDSLTIHCSDFDSSTLRFTGNRVALQAVGGTGGTDFSRRNCPAGKAGRGFRGTDSSSYWPMPSTRHSLNSIGLVCAQPFPGAPMGCVRNSQTSPRRARQCGGSKAIESPCGLFVPGVTAQALAALAGRAGLRWAPGRHGSGVDAAAGAAPALPANARTPAATSPSGRYRPARRS